MTTHAKRTKKIGRPIKAPSGDERVSLGLRVTADIKRKLDAAIVRTGRTQSQEVELSLERTFAEEDRLGGPQLLELIETIASAMRLAGQHAGFLETHRVTNRGEWLARPYAYEQATKAAIKILEMHKPLGEIVEPKWNLAEVVGEETTESKEMRRRLHADLGELFALKVKRDQEEGK